MECNIKLLDICMMDAQIFFIYKLNKSLKKLCILSVFQICKFILGSIINFYFIHNIFRRVHINFSMLVIIIHNHNVIEDCNNL